MNMAAGDNEIQHRCKVINKHERNESAEGATGFKAISEPTAVNTCVDLIRLKAQTE